MKIGIIGAGEIGGTLTRRLTALGHQVSVANSRAPGIACRLGRRNRCKVGVAGDDLAAKAVVLRLVDELGFDGVDAGTLDQSWRQQPDTPVYGTNFDAEGVRRALSEASKERKPEWRAT